MASDFGECWRALEWMGLQRHLKVLGIFARLSHRDGKDRYLADLPLVLRYVQEVATRYVTLAPLSRLIDRIEGRTGHGIWLHGVPSDTFARPPQSSDGCVVLANPDFDALLPLMQIGLTPVVIAPRIDWVDAGTVEASRASLAQAVEAWRRDWEGRDMQAYLRHYSPAFSGGSAARDLAVWSEQKSQVNASKTWVRIGLRNTSMFLDPNRDNLAVVQFEQDYASNNLNQQMRKRQYWKLEGGRWRIVYEGNA
jgi:hypothetical protein